VATPIYHTSWAGDPQSGHARSAPVADRVGSWFGGTTPLYLGSGQPAPDRDGSIGGGTPAYVTAPPPPTPQDAATAPQPKQVAIVVPRT
jgi:hypothetical protein